MVPYRTIKPNKQDDSTTPIEEMKTGFPSKKIFVTYTSEITIYIKPYFHLQPVIKSERQKKYDLKNIKGNRIKR